MKTENIKDFKYKHILANISADVDVTISSNGRKLLSGSEIIRLGRLCATDFFSRNYHKAQLGELTINCDEFKALMAIMGVDQQEMAKLLGCSEAKISRALSLEKHYQPLGTSLIMLLMERLGMELARPNSCKSLANRKDLSSPVDVSIADRISNIRYNPTSSL